MVASNDFINQLLNDMMGNKVENNYFSQSCQVVASAKLGQFST